jgi:hypothetical protein
MSAFQGLIMLAMYHGFITFGLSLGLIVGASSSASTTAASSRCSRPSPPTTSATGRSAANYGWVFTAYGIAGLAAARCWPAFSRTRRRSAAHRSRG